MDIYMIKTILLITIMAYLFHTGIFSLLFLLKISVLNRFKKDGGSAGITGLGQKAAVFSSIILVSILLCAAWYEYSAGDNIYEKSIIYLLAGLFILDLLFVLFFDHRKIRSFRSMGAAYLLVEYSDDLLNRTMGSVNLALPVLSVIVMFLVCRRF